MMTGMTDMMMRMQAMVHMTMLMEKAIRTDTGIDGLISPPNLMARLSTNKLFQIIQRSDRESHIYCMFGALPLARPPNDSAIQTLADLKITSSETMSAKVAESAQAESAKIRATIAIASFIPVTMASMSAVSGWHSGVAVLVNGDRDILSGCRAGRGGHGQGDCIDRRAIGFIISGDRLCSSDGSNKAVSRRQGLQRSLGC